MSSHQQIGISKAIGASDGSLLVLFLTEASILGFVGGPGGLLLGRVVSWALGIAVNYYTRSQGVEVHMTVFAFPTWLLVAVVLFSVAIAVPAGVYLALRAAGVDPIRALRAEQRAAGVPSRHGWHAVARRVACRHTAQPWVGMLVDGWPRQLACLGGGAARGVLARLRRPPAPSAPRR